MDIMKNNLIKEELAFWQEIKKGAQEVVSKIPINFDGVYPVNEIVHNMLLLGHKNLQTFDRPFCKSYLKKTDVYTTYCHSCPLKELNGKGCMESKYSLYDKINDAESEEEFFTALDNMISTLENMDK